MPNKQLITIGLGLRTGVLKVCPEHCQIYCDDDVDPARAFALAAQLVQRHNDYVEPFAGYSELAELLGDTVSAAPKHCPRCEAPATTGARALHAGISPRRVLEIG